LCERHRNALVEALAAESRDLRDLATVLLRSYLECRRQPCESLEELLQSRIANAKGTRRVREFFLNVVNPLTSS